MSSATNNSVTGVTTGQQLPRKQLTLHLGFSNLNTDNKMSSNTNNSVTSVTTGQQLSRKQLTYNQICANRTNQYSVLSSKPLEAEEKRIKHKNEGLTRTNRFTYISSETSSDEKPKQDVKPEIKYTYVSKFDPASTSDSEETGRYYTSSEKRKHRRKKVSDYLDKKTSTTKIDVNKLSLEFDYKLRSQPEEGPTKDTTKKWINIGGATKMYHTNRKWDDRNNGQLVISGKQTMLKQQVANRKALIDKLKDQKILVANKVQDQVIKRKMEEAKAFAPGRKLSGPEKTAHSEIMAARNLALNTCESLFGNDFMTSLKTAKEMAETEIKFDEDEDLAFDQLTTEAFKDLAGSESEWNGKLKEQMFSALSEATDIPRNVNTALSTLIGTVNDIRPAVTEAIEKVTTTTQDVQDLTEKADLALSSVQTKVDSLTPDSMAKAILANIASSASGVVTQSPLASLVLNVYEFVLDCIAYVDASWILISQKFAISVLKFIRAVVSKIGHNSDKKYLQMVDHSIETLIFTAAKTSSQPHLQGFCSNTWNDIAKFFSNFRGLENGIVSITNMFTWLKDTFINMVQVVVEYFFPGTFVKLPDIEKFMIETLDLEEKVTRGSYIAPEISQTYIETSRKVLLGYANQNSGKMMVLLNVIRNLRVKLIEGQLTIPTVRRAPFVICIKGDPRAGKSVVMASIMKTIHSKLNLNTDPIYSRNPCSDFWDGYKTGTFGCIFDDFMQEKEGTDALEVINCCSTNQYMLPMASLDNASIGKKGTVFESEIVGLCTNHEAFHTAETIIHFKKALTDRMHMVLEARKIKNEYDTSGKFEHLEFDLLVFNGKATNTLEPVMTKMSYSDILSEVIRRYLTHVKNQVALVELLRSPPKAIKLNEDHLSELSKLVHSSPMHFQGLHDDLRQVIYTRAAEIRQSLNLSYLSPSLLNHIVQEYLDLAEIDPDRAISRPYIAGEMVGSRPTVYFLFEDEKLTASQVALELAKKRSESNGTKVPENLKVEEKDDELLQKEEYESADDGEAFGKQLKKAFKNTCKPSLCFHCGRRGYLDITLKIRDSVIKCERCNVRKLQIGEFYCSEHDQVFPMDAKCDKCETETKCIKCKGSATIQQGIRTCLKKECGLQQPITQTYTLRNRVLNAIAGSMARIINYRYEIGTGIAIVLGGIFGMGAAILMRKTKKVNSKTFHGEFSDSLGIICVAYKIDELTPDFQKVCHNKVMDLMSTSNDFKAERLRNMLLRAMEKCSSYESDAEKEYWKKFNYQHGKILAQPIEKLELVVAIEQPKQQSFEEKMKIPKKPLYIYGKDDGSEYKGLSEKITNVTEFAKFGANMGYPAKLQGGMDDKNIAQDLVKYARSTYLCAPFVRKENGEWVRKSRLHCIGLHQVYYVFNSHFFDYLDATEANYIGVYIYGPEVNPILVPIDTTRATRMVNSAGEMVDAIVYDFTGTSMPHAKSLLNCFFTKADAGHLDDNITVILAPYRPMEKNVPQLREDGTMNYVRKTEYTVNYLHGASKLLKRMIEYENLQGQKKYMVGGIGYLASTQDGDCGVPIVFNKQGLSRKIIGIHSLGSGIDNFGAGFLITQEMLIKAMEVLSERRNMPLHLQSANLGQAPKLEDYDEIEMMTPCIPSEIYDRIRAQINEKKIVDVGGAPAVVVPKQYVSRKTAFVKTDIKEEIEEQMDIKVKEPSEKTNHQGQDPLLLSSLLYYVDTPNRDIFKYADQIIPNSAKNDPPPTFSFRNKINDGESFILTPLEAIGKVDHMDPINLHTSPGFPYVQAKLRKTDFIQCDAYGNYSFKEGLGDSLVKSIIDMIPKLQQRPLIPIWTVNMKDELIKTGKLARTFEIAPIEYTILVRMYFGAWVSAVQSKPGHSRSYVGVNPESDQWNRIFRKMEEYNKRGFLRDFEKYDKRMKAELVHMVGLCINAWYKLWDPRWCIEDDLVRLHLLHGLTHGPLYLLNIILFLLWGNRSGGPLTVHINTKANEIMHDRWFLDNIPMTYCDLSFYPQMVFTGIYGDDNMDVPTPAASEYLNGCTFDKTVREVFGMITTSATKDGETALDLQPIESFTFLKRGFRKHNGVWVPTLDPTSILSMLSFVRKNKVISLQDQFTANAHTALSFSYFHGKVFYECVQAMIHRSRLCKHAQPNYSFFDGLWKKNLYENFAYFKTGMGCNEDEERYDISQ
jgi:hypothetical protein